MANTQGNNGPRAGRSTGRNRNTLVNNASRGTPIDPQTALSLGSATAQAKYSLLSQLAALRANQAFVRGQYKSGLAGARAQRRTDVVAAANNALERGIIGSSVDLRGRAAAHTAFATERSQLQQEKGLGLLGIQQQAIEAKSQYGMSMADIAARQALAETLAQNQAQLSAAQAAAASSGSDYYSAYSDLLQQLLHQRTGNAPRKRRGLEDTVFNPNKYTAPGYNHPLF